MEKGDKKETTVSLDEAALLTGYTINKALEMVTWKNFRQRIEYCLNDAIQPFYVEFGIGEVKEIIGK